MSANQTVSSNGERDDIAIVGIGCRYPGGANNPEAFWRLLESGFNAITEVPESRAEFRDLYDTDPKKPGHMYTRRGAFLDQIDQFDAQFFGISPREAMHIDPQSRLLLELTWEACENAGIPPTSLAGTQTGVFVGVSSHDYGDIQMYPQHRADIDMHTMSGSATAVNANRISYLYDLRGPSVAFDTACSSALTALHFACQSMRTGDCSAAIVAGVQLLIAPEASIGFCKASMLSKDSECRAFDAEANGYVRGEGAGVVLLRPLSAALADGDRIYAIIRATAVNQDGHTNGMTVPSAAAQQAMMESALAAAGVCSRDVQYVEAHGTGTPIGDPIEASAIGAVMGRLRKEDERCAIGSVKTNIGHLEAGSGMAGVIKVALSLRNRKIPPSLHFSEAPAAIDLAGYRLRVVTKLEAWPEPDRLPIAGVNSFGFGGANAHAVLQGATEVERVRPAEASIPRLLTLSAKSPEALKALAYAYSDLLFEAGDQEVSLRDICYTAAERRSHLEYRLAVVASTKEDFATYLLDFNSGVANASVQSGRVPAGEPQKLAFVFSGMGPQWWGMGRQLLASEPVFLSMMEACDRALRPHSGWSLLEKFAADESTSRIATPELAQVTNFALQVALAEMWASWGIKPSAVIGHSGGAIAAAYVAGVHSLEDAIRLAYHRSRLTGRPCNSGRMLAVGATYEDIAPLLVGTEALVAVSAINAPASITLTGDGPTLERICAELQERKIFARLLAVTIAYHSPLLEQVKDELLASIAGVKGQRARVPFVSDLTGTWCSGEECNAEYWWRAIREPVLFRDGVNAILSSGIATTVEIGPHPVLSASVLECMKGAGVAGVALPTIRRNENERAVMLRSLGSLHTRGQVVNWGALREDGSRATALPHYPWQRSRHWFEPSAGGNIMAVRTERKAGDPPLLGTRMHCARPVWQNVVGTGSTEYLRQHVIHGSPVYPGAAYIEMALEWSMGTGHSGAVVRDIEFLKPLLLQPEQPTSIQFARDAEDGRFEVYSATADGAAWISHSRGKVVQGAGGERPRVDLAAAQERTPNVVDASDFYLKMADRDLGYGPAFQGIKSLWTAKGEALGLIELKDEVDCAGYCLHPALLDAAFQVLVAAVNSDPLESAEGRLFLPASIKEFVFFAPAGKRFWANAKVVKADQSSVLGEIQIVSEDGSACAEVKSFTARLVEVVGGKQDTIDRWLYDFRWEPEARAATEVAAQVEVLGYLPAGPDLDEAVKRADALSAKMGWRLYDRVEEKLNELAAAYITEASLGKLRVAPGSWRESLVQQLGKNLKQAGGAPTKDSATLTAELLRDFPAHRLDIELLERCGPRLADVVTGRADGQDVLFTGDGFAFLEKFYRAGPGSAYYNAIAGDLVADFAAAFDGKRPLRILEVGAGTGGLTSALLPRLNASNTSYTFSDVSPVFLDRARTQFAGAYPFLSTRLFDVTADPAAQGFEGGQYDLIAAANVLHATADVKPCVERLRSLLAPGGVLLLLELTRVMGWLDIVFGLFDGWWKFEDRGLRPHHPLMSGAVWKGLLAECGFEGTAVLTDTVPDESPQSFIFGRRPAATAEESRMNWLIFADEGGVAKKVAATFAERSIASTLVHAADADFDRLSEEAARGSFAGIVHLWNLDVPQPHETAGVDEATFATAHRLGLESVTTIVQRLLQDSPLARGALVLVTAGAQQPWALRETPSLLQTAVWGIARSMRKEWPQLRCRAMDLSVSRKEEEIVALIEEILSDDGRGDAVEDEIAFRGEERFVHRLRRISLGELADAAPAVDAAVGEKWQAHLSKPGSFDSVVFLRTERGTPGPHEVEIAVSAAALNFRDVVLGMDAIEGLEADQSFGARRLGYDLAGTITRCGDAVTHLRPGDEVFGIVGGSFASYVLTDAALVFPKPQGISLEEAASIPVAYFTAYYALRHLARLSKGESVLIHVATGGVGLAAIQIAKACGARIFATAGSPAKRSYLESLGVTDVMDSRTLEFADEIAKRTGGRGVDVVLNSLRGEALELGIASLAPYGRFVEIGKSDIYSNQRLQLLPFRRNLSLFALDVDRLCFERPDLVSELLGQIAGDFETGVLVPIPYTKFPMRDLAGAMRFMAQAKHIGKVIVTNEVPVPVRSALPAKPLIRADATYLITGGLGGVGMLTAGWLVEQGATSLVLMGRNPPALDTEVELEELRLKGVRVEPMAADVSKPADVERVLTFIRAKLPPLRGILHAAMVMSDTQLVSMDSGRLSRVMAPKVSGAWNLHCLTLGEDLDFFVSFSSIVSLLGNSHQANYGAANAFLDGLAAYRRAQGLKATTINWGVLSGTGWVARQNEELQQYLDRQGFLSFRPSDMLAALSEVMRRDVVQVMAARIDWATHAEFNPRAAASPRIRHLIPAGSGTIVEVAKGSIRALLNGDQPAARPSRMERYLREQVAALLGGTAAAIEPEQPITNLGLDSLIAAELITVLDRDLDVQMAGTKLLSGISIRLLALDILGQMHFSAEAVVALQESVKEQSVAPVSAAPVVESGIVDVKRTPPASVEQAIKPAEAAVSERLVTPSAPVFEKASPQVMQAETKTKSSNMNYTDWSPAQRRIRLITSVGVRMVGRIDAAGLENIPKEGPCVLATNHLSMADFPVILTMLPRRAIMLAKEGLKQNRFINWLISDMGQAIYLSKDSDEDAIERSLTVLKSGGLIALAPEGTRSKTGALLRGRTGAARLATLIDVPVVPMVAWGQEKWRDRGRQLGRIPIHVRVGVPMRFPQGAATATQLRIYTDQIMMRMAEMLPPEYRGVYGHQPEVKHEEEMAGAAR